jgi:hypothetical protein
LSGGGGAEARAAAPTRGAATAKPPPAGVTAAAAEAEESFDFRKKYKNIPKIITTIINRASVNQKRIRFLPPPVVSITIGTGLVVWSKDRTFIGFAVTSSIIIPPFESTCVTKSMG